MKIIYQNNTEQSAFDIAVLSSDILGGIHTIALFILIIPAVLVSFNTIKRFRGLRKVPYKDEFQTKIYASYKERATRCMFLLWFLSVEVSYFLTYNLGTILEQFVSANSRLTIGTNCTLEAGTFLSESFSTNPITLLSNLIASLHMSLNVYYLEILCILVLYLRMALKEKIKYRKLVLFVIISTLYWIATMILYTLPWTVAMGYAIITISSQILIVIAFKQTKKLLRELKFKIQDLFHADDRKVQPVKEQIKLRRKYQYFLLYLIAAFQLLISNHLIVQMPYYFIQNIALNSCYYRVVYGVKIPSCIEYFLNLAFNEYEFAVVMIQGISDCLFFLLMVIFYIHLCTVLLLNKYRTKDKWRFGGTANLKEPLINQEAKQRYFY